MEAVSYTAPASDVVAAMDRKGIATMVNLTGGRGAGLEQVVRDFDRAYPGRFITFTEPWWAQSERAGLSRVSGRADPAGPRAPAREASKS